MIHDLVNDDLKKNKSDFNNKFRKYEKFQSHGNIFDGDMMSLNFDVMSNDFDIINTLIEMMSSPNLAHSLYFKECACWYNFRMIRAIEQDELKNFHFKQA